MDETEGWADFRSGYGSENRKFLAASFPGTPWILASATLDDEAIASIATSLGTSRLNHHNYPEIQIPTESATERQIYRTGTENTTTLIKF